MHRQAAFWLVELRPLGPDATGVSGRGGALQGYRCRRRSRWSGHAGAGWPGDGGRDFRLTSSRISGWTWKWPTLCRSGEPRLLARDGESRSGIFEGAALHRWRKKCLNPMLPPGHTPSPRTKSPVSGEWGGGLVRCRGDDEPAPPPDGLLLLVRPSLRPVFSSFFGVSART